MGVWEYRELIAAIMRINKNNSTIVLKELEDMGLISYDKESETVRIL